MASISLTNVNGDLDFPDPIFTETAPVPRQAFENGLDHTTELSPAPCHDELMGDIPIYTIWMRKFDADKAIAGQAWQKFRKDAIDLYDEFDRNLKNLENELNTREESSNFLDIDSMLEKQANTDAVCEKIDECGEKLGNVTKIFEQFSQYLPKEDLRLKVDSMTNSLRERYFNLLQQRNKRREIFRWIIPRLQRYRSSGSEIKTWLDSTETRCESLRSSTKKSGVTQCEDAIEQLVVELTEKRDVYEDFTSGGRGILSIQNEINKVFNVRLGELEGDVNDVTQRWDALSLTLENFLDAIAKEKQAAIDAAELSKKTETEKIDIKMRGETQHCTCATPFRVKKVGDGKYTFGTSKTVRLLRIHGQSIVVRVGGGWEYVYNFLMKVDPCRAKAFAPGSGNNAVDAIRCNTGLTLTPLDDNDSSFTMSVQRMRKTSVTPGRRTSRALRSSVSIDELDSCGDVFDSLNLSRSSSSMSNSPRDTRSKSRSSTVDVSKNGTSTPNDKPIASKKLSNTDSKLYKSSENINRKKSSTRRLSLMDRQALYAQKRSSSLVQATSVLDL